jgi:predicted nucleic acid-binding protein
MTAPIFVDTSCFIYLIEGNIEFGSIVKDLFDEYSIKQTPLVSSYVSLAEVLVKPFQQKNDRVAEQYYAIFSKMPNLTIAPLLSSSAVLAAQIKAKYAFQLPDAFQLALAVESDCKTFLTNDSSLLSFSDLKIILLSHKKKSSTN